MMKSKGKYLSKILRHTPKSVGLHLDSKGWASVEDVLSILKIDKEELTKLVVENGKQRFEIEDGKIRACQGHSIDVDLELPSVIPPSILLHGTATKNLPSIKENGITKQERIHVQMTEDVEIAVQVGSRHGVPYVLSIDAARMHKSGYIFHQSGAGVWLTDHVPARYIRF